MRIFPSLHIMLLTGLYVLAAGSGCHGPAPKETAPVKSPRPPRPLAPERPASADGTVPAAATPAAIVWKCSSEGLDPLLLESLTAAAREYLAQTGAPVMVNSGRRTLRHQARLMSEFTVAQLEGMYCNHGYPSYIRDIVAARRAAGRQLTALETYEILCARSAGYISSHLFGAAVDLAPPRDHAALLKRLLRKHGFRVLDERSLGIQCIHATHTAVPRQIVRE